MSGEAPLAVLFLCTGNSARSILAEYLLRKTGRRRFDSYSAGSDPRGEVHPLALRLLKEVYKIDASDARSKSWEEYRDLDFDFVITVCDNARESCPLWPGQPIVAHWGVPDPADFHGAPEEHYALFKEIGRILARRIELFCHLPFDKLDRLRLAELTREIESFMTAHPEERPWTCTVYPGTDGSTIFRGGVGHSLVIDPAGRLWRARSYEDFETTYRFTSGSCVIDTLTPLYAQMREYRPR